MSRRGNIEGGEGLKTTKNLREFNVLIAGVGGQGNVLVSEIIAMAAVKAGLKVRVAETYGGTQRGGPVMSHVRMGSEVHASLICPGEADVVLSLEISESTRRTTEYLRNDGLALVNNLKVEPLEVIIGQAKYPDVDKLIKIMKNVTKNLVMINATKLAKEAGDAIVMNVVMLGALVASGKLPFSMEYVRESLRKRIPERFLDLNLKAFELGINAFKEALKN